MNRWLAIAVAVVAADQASKVAADALLSFHDSIALLPVLSLTLGYNPGAAFSILGDAGGWQRWFLSAIAVLVSGYLVHWLRQVGNTAPLLSLGLALVLGGAVGNLIDRLRLGYVIDFIHLHYRDFHWPVFNVADIAITVGVGLVLLTLFRAPPAPEEGGGK